MISVDTNILVRLFTGDDEAQTARAARLVDEADEPVFVNLIVVLETLWTLKRAYRFDEDRLVIVLRKLTEHPAIICSHKDLMRDAAHRTKEEGGDLPDNLIALMNQSAGCSTTFTFDRDAAQSDGFTLLTD
ncbi:type II toxin-antitoxin system VapC family toxin [Methylopila sp. 73B]|uniref:PIN domain-containing protein n=1 Tax=Methylopila sp. 73B TaxID=1120792 RepID=UPI00035D43BE|nr:type II toxin-antitoxin system VapC family toxin [Methylopila sp. 73B]